MNPQNPTQPEQNNDQAPQTVEATPTPQVSYDQPTEAPQPAATPVTETAANPAPTLDQSAQPVETSAAPQPAPITSPEASATSETPAAQPVATPVTDTAKKSRMPFVIILSVLVVAIAVVVGVLLWQASQNA